MWPVIAKLIEIVAIILGLVLMAAGLTWVERRLLALWQDRYGPNRAGPFGILQPLADVVKILLKEDWIPPFGDRAVFVIAPAIAMIAMMLAFVVIPIGPNIGLVHLNVGLLFFLAMTSLSVYSVALGGWASNSKYALLGGLRSAAQMISYEVFMGLSLLGVVMQAGTFNLEHIVQAQTDLWYCFPQILGLLIFTIAGVAETHRLPFDLPEAEHELIAGYQTEYSGMKFGLFFVGEYVGMVVTSAMIVTLFFGGWLGPWLPPVVWFLIKLCIVVGFFILLRAALPRPRFDQLMAIGWKYLLPLSLVNLVLTGLIVLWAGGGTAGG